jgi:hypothetical protein
VPKVFAPPYPLSSSRPLPKGILPVMQHTDEPLQIRETQDSASSEVRVILTGAERSRMVWNALGADTPGAFCSLA